jgi:hypothetical protein
MECDVSELETGEPAREYMRGKIEARVAVQTVLLQKAREGDMRAIDLFTRLAELSDPDVKL